MNVFGEHVRLFRSSGEELAFWILFRTKHSNISFWLVILLDSPFTQHGGTNDCGEKRNVLIVSILLLIGSNLTLRSNMQGAVECYRWDMHVTDVNMHTLTWFG